MELKRKHGVRCTENEQRTWFDRSKQHSQQFDENINKHYIFQITEDTNEVTQFLILPQADIAQGIDNAHNIAECSNMGVCDRTVGLCTCRKGTPAWRYL